MRKISVMILAIIFLFTWQWAIQDARLLRFPNINRDLVVFVYAGDIWSVPACWRRRPAADFPSGAGAFSQNLSRWALDSFFGRVLGLAPGVCHGGRRRHAAAVDLLQRCRHHAAARRLRLRGHGLDAGQQPGPGALQPHPLGRTHGQVLFWFRWPADWKNLCRSLKAAAPTFSPDANKIVYTPIEREFRTWKRYKGGRAQDVWIYDLQNNTSRRLTDFPGTDQHPAWYGDKIYFVSDRDLTLNIYAFDLKTDKIDPDHPPS